MSEQVKRFGSGAIISALLIFTITGVFGWIGVTTAEVPALKAQAMVQFKNINDSLNELTQSNITTNKTLVDNSNKQEIILNTLSSMVYDLNLEVKLLKKDCDDNTIDVKECWESRNEK